MIDMVEEGLAGAVAHAARLRARIRLGNRIPAR
jgi:hypothetical protein